MAVRSTEVLVIGAGAAGLFCAITAGRRGRSVVVLDHADKIGKKILISGGGRCNFTNLHAGPGNYLSANPHFCKSALSRFTPGDFVDLIVRHGIPYHEKKLGQLFCDGSAKDIVRMLLSECAEARVELNHPVSVEAIEKQERFHLRTTAGEFHCDALVIACGGLSIPTIGASDFGYRIARQFAIAVVETDPALVPITLESDELHADLSGVSLQGRARAGGVEFEDGLLFTHRGLSGPALLQASSYWRRGTAISIDLSPEVELAALLSAARSAGSREPARAVLAGHLPKRLVQAFVPAHAGEVPAEALSDKQLDALARTFHGWTVHPSGTEGYRKAEVTRGGVDTRELSSQTMEARRVPGLHFIGEVVDVTGWLGGYNFQWAWASGHACGSAV